MLFNVDELVAQTNTAQESALPKKQSEWLKALLACPVYEEQKRLGGRAVPNDAVLIRLLEAIDERGANATVTPSWIIGNRSACAKRGWI
jgi:hypothetical protein